MTDTPGNNRYDTDDSSHKSSLVLSRQRREISIGIGMKGKPMRMRGAKFPSVVGVSKALSPLGSHGIKPIIVKEPVKQGVVEICVAGNDKAVGGQWQRLQHDQIIAGHYRRSSGNF